MNPHCENCNCQIGLIKTVYDGVARYYCADCINNELAALRAEVAKLQESLEICSIENNELHKMMSVHSFVEQKNTITALTKERDEAREALEKYGLHLGDCESLRSLKNPHGKPDCTCGLTAALQPQEVDKSLPENKSCKVVCCCDRVEVEQKTKEKSCRCGAYFSEHGIGSNHKPTEI